MARGSERETICHGNENGRIISRKWHSRWMVLHLWADPEPRLSVKWVPGADAIRYQNLIKLEQVNGFFPQSWVEPSGKKEDVAIYYSSSLGER